MPSETEREARERREQAGLEYEESQTCENTSISEGAMLSTGFEAGAEYEAPIARQAERAAILPAVGYIQERCRAAWDYLQDSGVMREPDGRTGNEDLDVVCTLLDEIAFFWGGDDPLARMARDFWNAQHAEAGAHTEEE